MVVLQISFVPTVHASTEKYNGIDVSIWQNHINFDKVKYYGKEIVYIRAGYGLSEDKNFHSNALCAKKANLKVGFYFYVTATNVIEAQEQAEYFSSLISKYHYDCIPAVDFEEFKNLSINEINNIAFVFTNTLAKRTNTIPLFYTDSYNASHLWSEELTKYPLWIADYYVSSPYSLGHWSNWSAFQYSDKGEVPGISTYVDLDYFTSDVLIKKDISSEIKKLPFTDVWPSDWYYSEVYHLYNDKLICGISPTLFAPNMPLQRDMAITILYRLDNSPTPIGINNFSDVKKGSWYLNCIVWANHFNIAKGYSDGRFYPSLPTSREEFAVFLYRYSIYKGYDVTGMADLSRYSDSDKINIWALDAMNWAVSSGIINGTSQNTLSPLKNMSRAEMAIMFNRFLDRYSLR